MDFTFSISTLEEVLLVFVRIVCFISIAPIFGNKNVPVRVKIFLSAATSILVYGTLGNIDLDYDTVIDYAFLLVKEAVVGLTLGFVSNLVMTIIAFVGQFFDRETGFTMSTNFDPDQNSQVTISAELFNYLVLLIIIITNLHYFIFQAIVQSFLNIPLGNVFINSTGIENLVVDFITEYFVLGFRIAMPIFVGIVLLNVILGILAKSSPHMSMFSIGMQLKVITGLLIMVIIIVYIPNITNFLMETMRSMLADTIEVM